MSSDARDSPPRPVLLRWSTVLSFMTVLAAIGTVALHVVGAASQRAYMQYWGIDSGVFPKSTDLVLINGYHGLVNQSAFAFLRILANFAWWAIGAIGVAIYLFILLSPWDAGASKVSTWLDGRAKWVQRLGKCLIATLLVAAVIPFILLAWTLVMVVPDAVGQANGKSHAEREALEFMKGCEKSKHPCVELRKAGEPLGTGFVIDGSPSFIAIFDAQRLRARVLPREAVELISTRLPVLPSPPASTP